MKLTDAEIEKLRQSGIRLDGDGRFWHEGAEVTHHGLRAAFWRWLDRNPDGRWVLRLDDKRFVYLDVDDVPFVVRSARWEGERAMLRLSDDSDEELAYATLAPARRAGSPTARSRAGASTRACRRRRGTRSASASTTAACARRAQLADHDRELITHVILPPHGALREQRVGAAAERAVELVGERGLQRRRQLRRRRQALLGILGHAEREHALDVLGERHQLGRLHRLHVADVEEHARQLAPREGRPPGERAIGDDREREHVGDAVRRRRRAPARAPCSRACRRRARA